ncbi:LOW QUALITY PROTEIN: uncharacterized protein LOC124951742 [Vespa velutina]|uniref:LOW QUALITY PROTEIN: uncharacterized protein LOC124951742 n=1 Tax=Vespa velutina TaxID=202808 RepID=UPI001FB54790|nr:LOW QUALITY PROTEIN: uncharacterized protein LOC124951742 [Vespa velutina]
MADDPNRDILPVKEGSCIETFRSLIDPRERRLVSKLDRCQLEDKYLRLFEEASKLKKLSNYQEDKIKRLATKLMRVAANPRACVSLDCNDKNKITALEVENSKLKNKLSVLRNQLLSHTMSGVSPTRSRRPHTRPSSGLITCRSENSRIRAPSCQCIVQTHQIRNDDNDVQNYLVKIEELETQKKEMSSHIKELEKELESYMVNNQREKVVENIEYIKVWRQMKQLSDKLIAAQNTNESLNLQINDLKKILEETTKNNQEITVCLMAEKKRIAGIDGQIIKAKDSQLTLREKDEQIRDLMNEMKILQQHNNELIALSSKYGQVELENVELKKKFTQQFTDQQSFKVAFSTEQANIAALQTANEQLLMKLQYLQKNMDTLTVQLAIIQNDNKKHESSTKTESSNDSAKAKNTPKDMKSAIERCKKCCETFDKILYLEKGVNTIRQDSKLLSKCVQTDCVPCSISINTKEAGTSMMTSSDQPSSTQEHMVIKHQEVDQMIQEKNPLSREKMLKLLDQAQISTPLKAGRIGQSDIPSVVDCEAMQDFSQRHRDADVADHVQTRDLKNLLATLVDVLRKEYSSSKNFLIPVQEQTSLYRNPLLYNEKRLIKDVQTDINNNDETNRQVDIGIQLSKHLIFKNSQYEDSHDLSSENMKNCNMKKFCFINQDKSQNRNYSEGRNFKTNVTRTQNQVTRSTETGECNCTNLKKCHAESDCGYFCCTNYSKQSYGKYRDNVRNQDLKGSSSLPIKRSDNKCAKKIADTAYTERYINDAMNSFESWKMNVSTQKNEAFATEHLDRCKELLDECWLKNTKKIRVRKRCDDERYDDRNDLFIINPLKVNNMLGHLRGMGAMKSPRICNMLCRTEDQIKPLEENEEELHCNPKCPTECVDLPPYPTSSTPLLITNGQGLVEIHVLSLQLATSAAAVLFQEENLSNVSLFISWNIWGQETVCTPTLKYPKLNFNSSFVYHIPDLFTFFNCALSEYVIFQANVVEQNTTTYAVAKAKLSIKDILDYPQNKLHYIAPMNSVISCTLGMNFGQLSLWVRLSCDVEQVDAFKRQCGLLPPMQQIQKTIFQEDLPTLKETNEEYRKIFNDTAQVMSDINEKKKCKEEIENPIINSTNVKSATYIKNGSFNNEMTLLSKQSKEIARWATKEEENNNVIQADKVNIDDFNSFISHVRFIFAKYVLVKNQRRINFFLKLCIRFNFAESRNVADDEHDKKDILKKYPLEKDTIVIEINKIILFENSSVMLDDEVHLLYVEYSFLGYRGADMETESVMKPKTAKEPLIYNFKKIFPIDEEYHPIERNTLRAMLNESINPNIKFILVSEPLPEETDIKDCVEIGYAYFNIREYALGDNDQSITLPIIDEKQTEKIGSLTVNSIVLYCKQILISRIFLL